MIAKKFIDSAIGKPWVSRACGPDSYDCWGLVIASFRDIEGVILPKIDLYADYGNDALAGNNGIASYTSELSTGEHGDIMVMYNANGDFEHVGRIFHGSVLHAWGQGSNGTGQVKFDRISLLKRLYKNKVEFRRYAYHC
ncbi:MAG TPA: hypothetical protein DDW91_02915 [Shewanella frigidimarina]|nr:hypothetical protein [Shewanella frigidimarina]